MKKLILVLSGILVGIFLLLSLLDRGEYAAERSLWKLNQDFSNISVRQESTPDIAINNLANRYRQFIKKYHKTSLAPKAQLVLANLYTFNKNYKQARIELQKVITDYPKARIIAAEAKAEIGKTYEIEDNWSSALTVYKQLIKEYPLENAGFIIPAYLAKKYEKSGKKSDAEAAYAQAAAFYKQIADSHPKSSLEYNSLKMLALSQVYLKQWDSAMVTLKKIMFNYPGGPVLPEVLRAINMICVTKTHDYDAAINLYTEFMAKFPDHGINKVISKLLTALNELKSKQTIVSAEPPK